MNGRETMPAVLILLALGAAAAAPDQATGHRRVTRDEVRTWTFDGTEPVALHPPPP